MGSPPAVGNRRPEDVRRLVREGNQIRIPEDDYNDQVNFAQYMRNKLTTDVRYFEAAIEIDPSLFEGIYK